MNYAPEVHKHATGLGRVVTTLLDQLQKGNNPDILYSLLCDLTVCTTVLGRDLVALREQHAAKPPHVTKELLL